MKHSNNYHLAASTAQDPQPPLFPAEGHSRYDKTDHRHPPDHSQMYIPTRD
uniref:Uncharacterized protein MANES_16G070600 n=1 Tax=Rhizophora mucronata TaxID=61149 RepID=A0A2P2IVX2_RHIMU